MVKITRDGATLAYSRNLRGILDYARKSPVDCVAVDRRDDGSANVVIMFADKSFCHADFADFTVAQYWVEARRSWGKPRTGKSAHAAVYQYS